jgi:exodeoxyribonuclease-3
MKPAKNRQDTRIISWNVNGLRAVLRKNFLSFLKECNADVVCLQEIKARPDQLADQVWPEGWEMHWNPAVKPGYSGTAVFSRIRPSSVFQGIGVESHDNEGRVLNVEFEDFHLVNVYVPNSQRDLRRLPYRVEQWTPDFLHHLSRLEQTKPVIFCGDMNVAHHEIDLARPKDNTSNAGFTAEERECFDRILKAGFVDTFRKLNNEGGHYTWWSYQNRARERNIGWRIDYVCVSKRLQDRVRHAFIWPEVVDSDHCPVGVDLRPAVS